MRINGAMPHSSNYAEVQSNKSKASTKVSSQRHADENHHAKAALKARDNTEHAQKVGRHLDAKA